MTREANAQLAVILGGSPLNTDVDPTLLDRIGGVDCRWLGLFGTAADPEDLDEMMTLFDKSNLEYHAVVLTVDRLTFAPSIKNRSDEENLELYRSGIFLFKNNWIELKNELDKVALIPVARALPGRLFVNHWVHQNMLAAKTAILMELGVPFEAMFSPHLDPWATPNWFASQDHQTDPFIEFQARVFRNRGLFDPDSHDPNGPLAQRPEIDS